MNSWFEDWVGAEVNLLVHAVGIDPDEHPRYALRYEGVVIVFEQPSFCLTPLMRVRLDRAVFVGEKADAINDSELVLRDLRRTHSHNILRGSLGPLGWTEVVVTRRNY